MSNKEKHFQKDLWRVLKEEEIAKAKFPSLDSSTQQTSSTKLKILETSYPK
jgi:hypothetical protein